MKRVLNVVLKEIFGCTRLPLLKTHETRCQVGPSASRHAKIPPRFLSQNMRPWGGVHLWPVPWVRKLWFLLVWASFFSGVRILILSKPKLTGAKNFDTLKYAKKNPWETQKNTPCLKRKPIFSVQNSRDTKNGKPSRGREILASERCEAHFIKDLKNSVTGPRTELVKTCFLENL